MPGPRNVVMREDKAHVCVRKRERNRMKANIWGKGAQEKIPEGSKIKAVSTYHMRSVGPFYASPLEYKLTVGRNFGLYTVS